MHSREELLEAENERLRGEITTLHLRLEQLRNSNIPRHKWIGVFIRDLGTNPYAQYRIHLIGVFYWLINFPVVTFLFFEYPKEWLDWGLYITLMYSIYANLATDYGSLSAAIAAYRNGRRFGTSGDQE